MSIARPSYRRSQKRSVRWLLIAALLASLLSAGFVPVAAQRTIDDPGDLALLTPQLEHPMQDEVMYFVLPDRFNDADPRNNTGRMAGEPIDHGYLPSHKGYYHGGDIRGIIERMDYLEGMGVTAIWMAPMFKNRPVQGDGTIAGSSAGYHGYWITDFTDVDPHFGTKEDLRWLVNVAHDRGIKVFFDIITNHTADVIDYAEGSNDYISKQQEPYRDANGDPFDDRDYAGTDTFPELDPDVSFPYTPIFPKPGDATVKVPAWLNNPIYYHNRGNSTFSGENSEYGDFVGLDDLFTEHPVVVDGMIDIYSTWVKDVGIDGFRIDTVKHVNMEFWQEFSPALLQAGAESGNPDFFMFGEVFSGSVPFVSQYATTGQLPATLDFPAQEHIRQFASQSQPSESLSELFVEDDYYTDGDGNAYRLPVFLGNHDMGRIGFFLKQDNPGASDAELLARDKLAHAVMFFSRGIPVIYYGDEQGFTGDGGDQDAREDMFPSQVASYNDNDLIGTNATTAGSNFDTSHPLYQTITSLAAIRSEHEALRRGAQIERYSSDEAGIYAFSRIMSDDDANQYEYVVAFNNAETAQSATFDTFVKNGRFAPVAGGGATLRTDGQGRLTVNVPALSFVIYKAQRDIPAKPKAPFVEIVSPTGNEVVTRRTEVEARVSPGRYVEVTFAVNVEGTEGYQVIGTDSAPPYRVFYDTSHLPAGTRLTFKAIANDLADDTATSVRGVTSDTSRARVGTPLARMVDVTLNVTVPATTDATGRAVHLAGELNLLNPAWPAWDPGAVQMTQVDATHWTISFTLVEETIAQYKYALGSWDFVEKGETCNELSNRILTVNYGESGTQVVNDVVVNWRNVAPCGD